MDFTPDSLVFIFNSTGEECLNVSLLDDQAIEGVHSFSASIVSTDPKISVSPDSQNITILDTDGKLQYSLNF